MTTRISIITINYNNKAGLQKTMDSVLNQSTKPFEFILIDGNSNDGSKDLISSHASQLTYWVTEPDRGIYHAMNKGILQANGDYLLFLNSGDSLVDTGVLEKINSEIDGSRDIYYGDILFEQATKTRKIVFPDQLSFSFFFTDNLSHQATFIKKSLFDRFFYYNEDFKIVSDWEFMIYAICKENVSYKHINQLVTLYDGSGYSSNTANYATVYAERAVSLQKYFPAFIADYERISDLEQRRIKQALYIKKFPFAWKVLKICIKVIASFLPKKL